MEYKIKSEKTEIKSRFTAAMAAGWEKSPSRPKHPDGSPIQVGDVISTSRGVRLSAVTPDGEVLASATCHAHPMTVQNFMAKIRRKAGTELRRRRLLARIEAGDFALPDLATAHPGAIIAAYIEYQDVDDPPEVPDGWHLWVLGTFFGARKKTGYVSIWDMCGCEASGLTATYADSEIFEYLEPGETLSSAQARLRETMIDQYRYTGPGPVMIVRAVEGTPIPGGYTELAPDSPYVRPDDHDMFSAPLEHGAGSYATVAALDFTMDTRTRVVWVRPTSGQPGAKWLCGCGVGSHTYPAPGTFRTQAEAEAFVRLWRDADVAERAHEERADLIGQEINISEPRLIVAGHNGSLWDAL